MQRKTIQRIGTVYAGVLLGALGVSPAAAFWGTPYAPACDSSCGSTCNTGCQTCPPGCEPCGSQPGMGHHCINYIETGRQANAMWPYPYICPDRVWAHAPFDIMVNNGWRRHNLLGPHHFDPDTGKLTRAGELKVAWILTQTPPSRRQLFIEQSMNSDVTAAHVATAQEFANSLSLGEEVLVQETHIRSPRRPASVVDRERTLYVEDRFPPIDFYLQTSGGGTTATSP